MFKPKSIVNEVKYFKILSIILFVILVLVTFLLFKNKDTNTTQAFAPSDTSQDGKYILKNKDTNTTQTFAPSDIYQDGKYIAGISLSDAEMDLVVEVADSKITSISLAGLDEKTSKLYKDLAYGIDYVNTYVTATQSLELPQNTSSSSATHLLMDALKVALSDDENKQITSTYEKAEDAVDSSEHTSIIEEEIIEEEIRPRVIERIEAIITKKDAIMANTKITSSNDVATVDKNMDVSYFIEEKMLREQNRALQVEELTQDVANENLDKEAKSKAAENLLAIKERIEKESDAEALLRAKGFREVYVRMDDNSVDVVINRENLSESDIAQIEEIVNRKTGYSVGKIKITPLKGIAKANTN